MVRAFARASRTRVWALGSALMMACGAEPPGRGPEPSAQVDGGVPFAFATMEPSEGSLLGDFAWDLPPGFPLPHVPADNPMSTDKVELGRHLFYDKRLSINERLSCASCHKQSLAFTDGRKTALGTTGEDHPRSAQSLANVAYAAALTWADPSLTELEQQALVPVLATHPVELGFDSVAALEQRLHNVPAYAALFARAFPEDAAPIRGENVARALAAFQRTLISGRSPFDRWLVEGDEQAVSGAVKRGFALFSSERLRCAQCHAGFTFSDNVRWQGAPDFSDRFHNNGLYDLDGAGAYPEPNTGVHANTSAPEDMGKFKAPSLRNVAVTSPYMHDGSIASLSAVLDHYAAGGRRLAQGPHAGDGSASPLKDPRVAGFELSAAERADVVAFLESLTDPGFLADPRFGNPW